MGRSNWIIAALGLLACVALSLLMEQALKVHTSKAAGPVTIAVDKAVSSRLGAPARFAVETVDGRRTGRLRLRPTAEANVLRLVRDAGEKAWLAAGRDRIDVLVVVCDDGERDIERFEVSPPWKLGAAVVRLADTPATPGR